MEISDIIQLAMVIITGIGIIASTFITNKNTNKQIQNQNKETYRPRLKLLKFENKNKDSSIPDYIAFSSQYNLNKDSKSFYTDMILKNIGYGLANDITFYNLCTSEEITMGLTGEKEINQKMFSTEEIEKSGKQKFSFCISVDSKSVLSREIEDQDYILIICNYKDLNNNNYKILIGYLIKQFDINMEEADEGKNCVRNNPTFDCYYYQENTNKYNIMIKKYWNNYNKIVKKIIEKDRLLKK